jgi:STE24 endopeptidase
LNASRQPDGFACRDHPRNIGKYPGWLKRIFFDHPAGENRIYRAMRWKAENLQLFQPSQKP